MIEDKLKDFVHSNDIQHQYISKEDLVRTNTVVMSSKGLIFETPVRIFSEFIPNPSTPRAFWGAHSYMNPGGYFRGGVFVGRYCSIGRRVSLGAGSHHLDWPTTSGALAIRKGRPFSAEEKVQVNAGKKRNPICVINSDVWIGDGAVIMPGVSVGIGAVIGANSVITHDVPPYAIVAGAPAKIIRHRFDNSVIEKLIVSSWWNYDKKVLDGIASTNVFEFLEWLDDLKLNQTPYTNLISSSYKPE